MFFFLLFFFEFDSKKFLFVLFTGCTFARDNL